MGELRTLSSAWPSCSLVYWKVREAKGATWPPRFLDPWHHCQLHRDPLTACSNLVFVREALLKGLEIHDWRRKVIGLDREFIGNWE